MKTKRITTLILACVMVLFAAFAIGCKKDGNSNPDPQPEKTIESVTLDNATMAIKAGETIDLTNYTVTAKFSDGTETTIPLTENMFRAEDLVKYETAGTYEIEVSAFGQTATLTLNVTNYDFEGVTANDVNVVYDGTAKVPTLENAPAGATVVWTYYEGENAEGEALESAPVNAGTYYAQGVVSLKYYNDTPVTANVVIEKQTFDVTKLTWNKPVNMYTGSAITANVTATNLPEGVTFTYEGAGKTGTAVGTYTVTVKFNDANSTNYKMSAETFDVEWTITASTWYGAENGTLYVADFDSTSDTTGTLTFNDKDTTYTVVADGNGNANFTELDGGDVTAISLKGGILRLTAGDKSYVLINKEDIATYFTGNKYDMLLAQFAIELDTTAKTLELAITTEDGEQKYPLTLSASATETVAKNVKLYASETLYLEYYYNYGVRINGFVTPDGYSTDNYLDLATKSAVAAALKNLVDGEFRDFEGNALVINGYEDIKYNGRAVKLYAVNKYGKVGFYTALNTDKKSVELALNIGYYKFDGEFLFNKDLIAKAGTYYLADGDTVKATETVEFLTSLNSYPYPIDVKTNFLNAENKQESKAFTMNGEVTKDRAVVVLCSCGEVSMVLYLQNEAEPYATLVFGKDGTSVTCNGKTFKKVDKLIEKLSSSTYYGADGTKLTYDGKGSFTFTDANGSKVYNKYTLEVDGEKLTINLVNGEDTCTIVSEDSRYITVDDKVYINEVSSGRADGYNLSATFIAGDSQVVFDKTNVTVKIGDKALTGLEFSFVDDGNNNGRTVLQIKGKKDAADETYVTVLYYSLAAIKVDGTGYAVQLLSPYYGVTYRPTEDAERSFTVATDGRLMINGKEVFIAQVGSSNITYYIEKDGKLVYCKMYDNSSYGYMTISEGGVQYEYNSDFFMEYRGVYVSEDNASVIAYLTPGTFYANETSYSGCKVDSITEAGTVILINSEKATLKNVDGQHVIEYNGKTYNQAKDFSLDSYFGTYSVLSGNNYDALTVPTNLLTNSRDVSLQKFVMYNGSYTPVITYNSYKKAYIIKNTDAATATALPYYAINEAYLKYAGDGKLDGKTLTIDFGVGTKDNKKVPVMSVLYDGKAVTLTNIASFKLTASINGKEYTIETASGSEKEFADLKVYESVYYDYSGSYNFNGNTAELSIQINEDGESVIVLKFNDSEVTATFADTSFGKTVTFTYGEVNYKGNLAKNATPRIMIATAAEYDFFFGATYNEDDDTYSVDVNGKTLKFGYEVKSISQNAYDYQFSFKSLSFDGKAATAAYYAENLKTIVFTTEDGTYAYNVATKTLTEKLTFNGAAALINNKNTSNGDVYVTARITSIEGTVVKVGLFYDYGNKGGLKAVTATEVDGGYKLTGEGLPTMYLLEEGDGYALYTEEQYLLVGTFEIGDKNLVITGTHANGKFTYTAAYDGAEAVAVTPDFTAKSFMIKGETTATLFAWTNENGVLNFTASEVPVAALKFLIDGDYMANLYYSNYAFQVRISLKGVDDGKVKFNVSYSTGCSWTTVEGTLSDDGTYISAYVYYANLQIYVNAVDDDYYELVAAKNDAGAIKYLGTFTVNDNEEVSIALGATSTDNDDEPEFDSAYFMVTYKGQTVKSKTKYSQYSSSYEIEFTVDGKTYVAKLVDGAMTVTEKLAA